MVLEALSRKAALDDITQDQVTKYRFLMLHQFSAGKMLRERSPGGQSFYRNLIHLYGRHFVTEKGGLKEATIAIGKNYRIIRGRALGEEWRKKGGISAHTTDQIDEDLVDLVGPLQLIRFEDYKDHKWGLLYAVLGTFGLISQSSSVDAEDDYFDEKQPAAYRRPWAYLRDVDANLVRRLKEHLEERMAQDTGESFSWHNFEKCEASPEHD